MLAQQASGGFCHEVRYFTKDALLYISLLAGNA